MIERISATGKNLQRVSRASSGTRVSLICNECSTFEEADRMFADVSGAPFTYICETCVDQEVDTGRTAGSMRRPARALGR